MAKEVIDQTGRKVTVPLHPKRIISLVPSQTELLFDLGLGRRIVGITKFCKYPVREVPEKTVIGGTKNFRFDIIDRLQPDLIIGNKEENYKSGIDRLGSKYPVWLSDIIDISDALNMISSIGTLTSATKPASTLIDEITDSLKFYPDFNGIRVLYLIWNDPIMAVGKGTFINSILKRLNMHNVILEDRYPEISIPDYKPDVILLSSEPFPFKEKHLKKFSEIYPNSEVVLVDGEMFSWYGSRLKMTSVYTQKLFEIIGTRTKSRPPA